ncbi:MAG: phytochelatin synthase family protein, partial [Gemmatimonadales bacterium]
MRMNVAGTAVAFFLMLEGGIAFGETLPLPTNLIALDSRDGEAMLIGAESRTDFFPLSMQFVTQAAPSYCGVASLVMLLNAFNLPGPASPRTAGMGIFDQDNVFTDRTEAVKSRASIDGNGMTLE